MSLLTQPGIAIGVAHEVGAYGNTRERQIFYNKNAIETKCGKILVKGTLVIDIVSKWATKVECAISILSKKIGCRALVLDHNVKGTTTNPALGPTQKPVLEDRK